MPTEEEILQYLRRIEDQQREGHKSLEEAMTRTNESVNQLALSCNTLTTQRQADIDAAALVAESVKDHEERLRRNEGILAKVTAFFTVMSTAFGAGLAWAVEKLLSGGGQ